MGCDVGGSVGGCEVERACIGPAEPAVAGAKLDAERVQTAEPGAQERGGLQRAREDAAGGASEDGLAEAFAPGGKGFGREGGDGGFHPGGGVAVARQEGAVGFAVGEIEAAAAG